MSHSFALASLLSYALIGYSVANSHAMDPRPFALSELCNSPRLSIVDGVLSKVPGILHICGKCSLVNLVSSSIPLQIDFWVTLDHIHAYESYDLVPDAEISLYWVTRQNVTQEMGGNLTTTDLMA